MKPRAMSVWIAPAASSAVWPLRSVHARVSCSPGREERDQVERVAQPARDLVERRLAAVAERRRLLVGQLGELGLELEVDPAGAVDDRDQRLRRQRLELGRQLARVVGERPAGVDVREHLLQLLELAADLRVTGLRLLLDALEPALDVVAVGDEQLELERLEIVVRRRVRAEAAQHHEQRVDLPEVPELRCARAGHVLDADRRGRDLACLHDLGQRPSRSSAIGAMPTFVFPYSPPPVFVSAVKSDVFPLPDGPTMPTSSATAAEGS